VNNAFAIIWLIFIIITFAFNPENSWVQVGIVFSILLVAGTYKKE